MNRNNYLFGFIGAGKMGEALLKGLLNKYQTREICFYEKDKERAYKVASETGAISLDSAFEVYTRTKAVFVCVKPDQVEGVLKEIKDAPHEAILISIAAGVATSFYRSIAPFKVIRIMPNTPALIGKGITAIAESPYVTEDEFQFTVEVLSSIGETVVVEENKMNAVTALSGSGPAYVFRFIEALKEAGINVGLAANIAEKLALETILGSCELYKHSGKSTSELVEMVASPGGTTIAGIKALENNRFKYAVMEAIEKAFERAVALEKKDAS
jgi:pyrroline-5-carboxylate reductase